MPKHLKEEKLQPIIIDFTDLESKRLDESWLAMMGSNIKWILKGIFGDWVPDARIKGTKAQVKSFIDTLSKERDYLRTFQRYGLDDPRTWHNRYKLDSSSRKFEDMTGLTWPFK